MLHSWWERGMPQLQANLFHKTQTNPFVSKKNEIQNHTQKSRSILIHPSEHEAARRTALQPQAPWSLRVGPAPPAPHRSFSQIRATDPRGREGASLCVPSILISWPKLARAPEVSSTPSQSCPFPRLHWQVCTSLCHHINFLQYTCCCDLWLPLQSGTRRG